MEIVAILAPFVLLGIGVLFVAFSGGPGQARQAYLTRGDRAVKVIIPLIFVGAGVAVPALVIAGSGEATGGTGRLADDELSSRLADGKELFLRTCSSCHTLGAVQAHGVTGPNLDELGQLTPERVRAAIREGGTGQGRMPADLLRGEDAELVAEYVARTAGK